MKKIVGYLDNVAYELGRFGSEAPKIGAGGGVIWGSEGVSGLDRVESVMESVVLPHLFCDWQKGLAGFWKVEDLSSGKSRWVCAADQGTGVNWLSGKLARGFDALAGQREFDKSVPWKNLAVGEEERFLLVHINDKSWVVNARNVMMVLERSHASLERVIGGDPEWVWGRGSINVDGVNMPVVNARKGSWEEDWGFGVGAAIVMPYLTGAGAVVGWCALLSESPKMLGKKAIDERVSKGEEIHFINERAMLGLCI